jgi:hypothetical protein
MTPSARHEHARSSSVCHQFRKNHRYAGRPRLSFRSAAVIGGKHHQGNLREQSLQFPRGLQPIHHRHAQVQDNQIWRQFFCFSDGVEAIFRFSTHTKSRLPFKCQPQSAADSRMGRPLRG